MSIDQHQRDFLERVRDGQRLRPATAEQDKVRQLCRKLGLVRYERGPPRKWVVTSVGHVALQGTAEPALARYATFLEEAARYFEHRPTQGEDAAHWSNVSNAETCRKIAALIASIQQDAA